jgi:predicted transport protein
MSDIKLFRLGEVVSELQGEAVQVEKSLQKLFEGNLEALLGVRFLASEYSTGAAHGGRIDTLGLDEDGTPVIIEYKRSVNENVVSQGLFYLDWLLDHRKEFQWLAMERLGHEAAKAVDWSAPRLLCIAGDFTRYDEHAVKQIARSIELLRYRRFGADLLMIELVHAPKQIRNSSANQSNVSEAAVQITSATGSGVVEDRYKSSRIAYRLSQASVSLQDLFSAIKDYLIALGDDVQVKELSYYVAFKRIKNFACLEVYPQTKVVTAFLKIDPVSLALEDGFTRDVTKVGHFGTGNLEVTIRSMEDFAKAQPLFVRSYEGS